MGWFSSKKKKPSVRAPDADFIAPSNSLQFQANADEEIIMPDHFKQAAGILPSNKSSMPPPPVRHASIAGGSKDLRTEQIEDDPGFSPMDQELLFGSSMHKKLPSQQQISPERMPLFSSPSVNFSEEEQDSVEEVSQHEILGPRVVNVREYKKILGTQRELKSLLSLLSTQGSLLEKVEYNDEKSFVRLKEQLRVAHNKLLKIDKKLFDTQ